MKRGTALIALSREHHIALVLAKQAQRLGMQSEQEQGASSEIANFMRTLRSRFSNELEPHFCLEETYLLNELDALSLHDHAQETIQKAQQLAQRTRDEHDALRHLTQRIAHQDFSSLGPWGELLAAHVRFEERELFGFIESVLSPHILSKIEAVSRQLGAQNQSI